MSEGRILWEPDSDTIRKARISSYLNRLQERGPSFTNYESAWRWSVSNIEEFWKTIWDYFDIKSGREPEKVLEAGVMPGARWFVGGELNFAEHFFRHEVLLNTAHQLGISTVGKTREQISQEIVPKSKGN